MIEETTAGSHYRIKFDSFGEYLDYHRERPGKKTWGSFNGAKSVAAAVTLAHTGMNAEGLKAIQLASSLLPNLDALTVSTEWQMVNDVTGGGVDLDAYLRGEPECMLNFFPVSDQVVAPIVTLVIATGILGHVSDTAITERGKRVMALLAAIELAGVQCEIWSDSTTHGRRSGGDVTGRISVRLKAAGEAFDAGTMMYAMTHDSMHRTLGFNTKDHFPAGKFREGMGGNAGYGSTALGDLIHADDYPAGTVYIPALRSNSDTLNVEHALRDLGLLAAA